ncbi:MAG: hypothetical protein JWO56_577, partial [Acidobacteria bacterium]|nr:hypothetical protein [Acidobacteriota bacterium]
MAQRFVRIVVLAIACALAGAAAEHGARAETVPPRDIWPLATAAADNNDVDAAIKKTNALVDTGKQYGIKTYPLYAGSAA